MFEIRYINEIIGSTDQGGAGGARVRRVIINRAPHRAVVTSDEVRQAAVQYDDRPASLFRIEDLVFGMIVKRSRMSRHQRGDVVTRGYPPVPRLHQGIARSARIEDAAGYRPFLIR
jgi:hypothetical protein